MPKIWWLNSKHLILQKITHMTHKKLPKNWAIRGSDDFADWIKKWENDNYLEISVAGRYSDNLYFNYSEDLKCEEWDRIYHILGSDKTIITFDEFVSAIDPTYKKDYSKDKAFWERLSAFISQVQVNDAMSEEERDMILSVSNFKIEQLND